MARGSLSSTRRNGQCHDACQDGLDKAHDASDSTRRGQRRWTAAPSRSPASMSSDPSCRREQDDCCRTSLSRRPSGTGTRRSTSRAIRTRLLRQVPASCPGLEDAYKAHKFDVDKGVVSEEGARRPRAQGRPLNPILSTFGLYFMGGGLAGVSFQAEEMTTPRGSPIPSCPILLPPLPWKHGRVQREVLQSLRGQRNATSTSRTARGSSFSQGSDNTSFFRAKTPSINCATTPPTRRGGGRRCSSRTGGRAALSASTRR